MRHIETAIRLRILIGEDDRYKDGPLYAEIVFRAQSAHLSGATVFYGYMGYGKGSGGHLSPGKILRTSKDLPIVIEILDSEAKVMPFLDVLDELLVGGVVTMEKVQMIRYSKKAKGGH